MSDSSGSELDIETEGCGHGLFDIDENGGNSNTDSYSPPSEPDDISWDPSYSSSISVSLAVPRRHTRADGSISPDTGVVEEQHPIRRVETNTALSIAGIEVASTSSRSSRVIVDKPQQPGATAPAAGSQTTVHSNLSHSESEINSLLC